MIPSESGGIVGGGRNSQSRGSANGGSDHATSSLSSALPSGQHVNVSVDSVPADEGNFAVIRGLKPATIFLCSVRAENDIGLSPSSHHIEIVSEEEGEDE